MTPRQILLVQDSFALLAPHRARTSELFYMRLLYLQPDLRTLFTNDLTAQGRKLMQVLGALVGSIDDMDAVRPSIAELGRRHVDYHVKESDYAIVGESLLWAFGEVLGTNFNGETRDAWSLAYNTIAGIMIEAAREGRPASIALRH